jgi:hypothetical protein
MRLTIAEASFETFSLRIKDLYPYLANVNDRSLLKRLPAAAAQIPRLTVSQTEVSSTRRGYRQIEQRTQPQPGNIESLPDRTTRVLVATTGGLVVIAILWGMIVTGRRDNRYAPSDNAEIGSLGINLI